MRTIKERKNFPPRGCNLTAVFGKAPESKLNLFLSRLLLSAWSSRRAPWRRAGTATRGSGRRSGAGRDAPGAEWERGSGAGRAAGLGAAGAGAGAQRTAEPALGSRPSPVSSAGTIPGTRQGKPGTWATRAPNLQVGRAGSQCLALGWGVSLSAAPGRELMESSAVLPQDRP